MGAHDRELFYRFSDLPIVAILGCIDDRASVFEVPHPPSGEGGSDDDEACQVQR